MNGWKVTAIIAIILLILETLTIVWIFSLGFDVEKKDSMCSINVCDAKGFDAYYYDMYSEVCYCYVDNEIVYKEVII